MKAKKIIRVLWFVQERECSCLDQWGKVEYREVDGFETLFKVETILFTVEFNLGDMGYESNMPRFMALNHCTNYGIIY